MSERTESDFAEELLLRVQFQEKVQQALDKYFKPPRTNDGEIPAGTLWGTLRNGQIIPTAVLGQPDVFTILTSKYASPIDKLAESCGFAGQASWMTANDAFDIMIWFTSEEDCIRASAQCNQIFWDKLKQNMKDVGVCYDEIIGTREGVQT